MSGRLTAVVIDDFKLFRDLLTEILQERGYAVTSYATPHEFKCLKGNFCRCTAEQRGVDLLLTDNRMIYLSGLELIEQLQERNCRLLAKNRAIISDLWTHEEKNRARQLGCQTFEKPFSLATIQTWLDNCEAGLKASEAISH
jgi:CheY-like chemotaxis protein